MGVSRLMTFTEKECKNAIVEVDLQEMVRQHRQRFGDAVAPLVVVDGFNCFVTLYEYDDRRGPPTDKLCGGQWLEFIGILRRFLNVFEQLGVRLVFFFDGVLEKSKIPEWFQRQVTRVTNCRNLFDTLEKNNGKIPPKTYVPTHTLSYAFRHILQHALRQQVFTNVEGDCDQNIASYARHHNAMAILADDTDYLIFDHKVAQLSVTKLDLEEASSVTYDQGLLCRRLKLPFSLLPVMACLVGNDRISLECLKPFHDHLYRESKRRHQRRSELIDMVVEFLQEVNGRPFGQSVTSPEALVTKVYRRAFRGHQDQPSQSDFEKAVDSYRIRDDVCKVFPDPGDVTPWNIIHPDRELLGQLKVMTVTNELSTLVYEVLTAGYQGIGASIQPDPNVATRWTWLPTATAFQPMRKRLYGLIFQLKDIFLERGKFAPALQTADHRQTTPDNIVTEYYLDLAKLKSIAYKISPTPVCHKGGPVDISFLLLDREESTPLKWAVLKQCTMTTISIELLQSLPSHYVAICIILNYLLQKEQGVFCVDRLWEIEAFILQAIIVKTTPDWVKRKKIVRFDSRGINLASLLASGIIELINVISICGAPIDLENVMPWNYFDGKTFHYCYTCLSELPENERSNFINQCLTGQEETKTFSELSHTIMEGFGTE